LDPSILNRTQAGGTPLPIDRRIVDRRQSTARIFVGTIVVVAVLYLAKPVFVPIAFAILFSFILRPAVGALERFAGRAVSAAVVLAVTVSLLGLAGWGFATQVSQLAREVAAYSGELESKVQRLQDHTGGSLELIERTLQRLAQTGQRPERADMRVRVIPEPKTIGDRYREFAPGFELVASTFLVVVLIFFLLKDREKLRDKILRLAGRANLTVTTQAIGEMTHRITRYIVTQATLNFGFGILVGLGLWLIGLPHPFVWAVVAALARFIPYIGAVASAAAPIILAFAVFPGWAQPLAVALLFLTLDQLIGGFIEPLVVGHRVGLSPVAILVAAIFWGWLWGPVGLLLAVPITVCLTVGGEFIPALRPFSILFGREAPLEGYLTFYNRLLSRDRAGAAAIADRFAEDSSMERTFSELFVPALAFANEECERERITAAQDHFIKDHIRELIGRLGDRNATGSEGSQRIVATSVGGERISLGTLMLAQLIRAEGWSFDFFTDLGVDQLIIYLREADPDAIFITCSHRKRLQEGYAMLGAIRKEFPDRMILAGGSAFTSDPAAARDAGATYVPFSLEEAKNDVVAEARRRRRMALAG
jgi:predicted PurR-regulated permease PerM